MPQKNDPEKTEGSAAEPQGAHRTDPKQTDSHGPDRRAPYKPKFAPLWNNLITIVGMFVVAMAVNPKFCAQFLEIDLYQDNLLIRFHEKIIVPLLLGFFL